MYVYNTYTTIFTKPQDNLANWTKGNIILSSRECSVDEKKQGNFQVFKALILQELLFLSMLLSFLEKPILSQLIYEKHVVMLLSNQKYSFHNLSNVFIFAKVCFPIKKFCITFCKKIAADIEIFNTARILHFYSIFCLKLLIQADVQRLYLVHT